MYKIYNLSHEPFSTTLINVDYQIKNNLYPIYVKFPNNLTQEEKLQVLDCLQLYGDKQYKFYLSETSWCGKLKNSTDKTC